jgi:AcrR family transcriptional regulator
MTSAASGVDPTAIERRSAILRAAYRVMSREGAQRTPLTKVAEEAGVSKALLLYYFERKDALIAAAFEWALNATATRIRQKLAERRDPAEAIDVVIDAVWIGPEANRDYFRFYLDGVDHLTHSPSSDMGAISRPIINGLYRDAISSAAVAGGLRVDDPEAAANTMRAIIEGFFLQWLQTDDWPANHSTYREQCRSAVHMIFDQTRL